MGEQNRDAASVSGRRRLRAWAIVVALGALGIAAVFGTILGGRAGAMSGRGAPALQAKPTIGIELGYGGKISNGRRVPIRVTIKAPRAVDGTLLISESNSGTTIFEADVEISATAPLVVLTGTSSRFGAIDVSLSDDDRMLASATRPLVADPAMAVGVGASLTAPAGLLDVDDVIDANVVQIDDSWWTWEAALFGLDQIVISPADIDRLEPTSLTTLHRWTELGGLLTIDADPGAVDGWLADGSGPRRAHGMGWVTFSGGAAADGRWASVVEPPVDGGWAVGSPEENETFYLDTRSASFRSPLLVALIALGLPILVGPLAWLVLKPTRRSRLWWTVPAAAALVGGGIVIAGPGSFVDIDVRAGMAGVASNGSLTGNLSVGIAAGSGVLAAEGGPEIAQRSGPVAVSAAGSTVTVRAGKRDAASEVRLAGYTLDDVGWLDISARITRKDDRLVVRVDAANPTSQSIEVGSVGISGSTEQLNTVIEEGESASWDVELPNSIDPLGLVDLTSWSGGVSDSSMVVRVSGTTSTSRNFGFGRTPTTLAVTSFEPVTTIDPGLPPGASLRVENLRTRLAAVPGVGPLDATIVDEVTPEGDGPQTSIAIEEGGAAVPGADPAIESLVAARLTAIAAFPGGTCAVHSSVERIRLSTGDGWQEAAVSEARSSERMADHEVRDVTLPPLPQGASLLLRSDQSMGLSLEGLVDCLDPGPTA